MDKNLHNDIGDLFHDEIEPLSQTPRKQVWENLDQQLDKNEAKQFRKKFITFRRMAAVLFFLLISVAIFALLYINAFESGKRLSNNTLTKKEPGKNSSPAEKYKKHQNYKDASADASKVIPGSSNEKMIVTNINRNNKTIDEERAPVKKTSDNDLFTNKKRRSEKDIAVELKANRNLKNNYEKNYKSVAGKSDKLKTHPSLGETTPNIQHPTLKSIESPSVLTMQEKFNAIQVQLPPFHSPGNKNLSTDLAMVKKISKTKMKSNGFSRFSLSAYAAPAFAGYNLENDEINQYDDKQEIADREEHELSFSTGILIGYDINEKLIIQTGAVFSSSYISINSSKIYAEISNAGDIQYRHNTSGGYGYLLPEFSSSPQIGDSLLTSTSYLSLEYLSIPVIAKYRVGDSKFNFSAGVGISFDFLTRATLTTEFENASHEIETTTELEGLQKQGYSLLLNPELQYRLSRKWSLSATPYFKYAFEPINKGNIVKTYPYTIGLGIGAIYRF